MSERIDPEFLRESEPPEPKPTPTPTPTPDEAESDFGGTQVSQGASGLTNAETSGGGADGVPDTPDDVAEPYVSDTDSTHRQG